MKKQEAIKQLLDQIIIKDNFNRTKEEVGKVFNLYTLERELEDLKAIKNALFTLKKTRRIYAFGVEYPVHFIRKDSAAWGINITCNFETTDLFIYYRPDRCKLFAGTGSLIDPDQILIRMLENVFDFEALYSSQKRKMSEYVGTDLEDAKDSIGWRQVE